MAVKVPLGLAVRGSLPVPTIAEFRDYVQARPGRMNYGSAGTGANSQLVNVLINQALGIDMKEVPYKGTAPALIDLAGGHVDALVDAIATLLPLHREGKIKILGNFDDARSPVAPEVPTFAESGYPGLVAFTWFAVVVPARVPEPVIARLNKAAMEAVESPQTKPVCRAGLHPPDLQRPRTRRLHPVGERAMGAADQEDGRAARLTSMQVLNLSRSRGAKRKKALRCWRAVLDEHVKQRAKSGD